MLKLRDEIMRDAREAGEKMLRRDGEEEGLSRKSEREKISDRQMERVEDAEVEMEKER